MSKMNWNRPCFNKNLGARAWDPVKKTKPHGHEQHDLKRVKTEHHYGKLVCVTCNNKFVKWLGQEEYFTYK